MQPAATRRPPLTFGTTSAATDREALVALHNATDGPNWDYDNDWLSDAPWANGRASPPTTTGA